MLTLFGSAVSGAGQHAGPSWFWPPGWSGLAVLTVSGLSGGATVDVAVQHSADPHTVADSAATWVTLASFAARTTNGSERIGVPMPVPGATPVHRTRALVTLGGSTPSATVTVEVGEMVGGVVLPSAALGSVLVGYDPVAPVYVTPPSRFSVLANGTVLFVRNDGAGSLTVTVGSTNYTVSAGDRAMLGPFPPENLSLGGDWVDVSLSSMSGVTACALDVPLNVTKSRWTSASEYVGPPAQPYFTAFPPPAMTGLPVVEVGWPAKATPVYTAAGDLRGVWARNTSKLWQAGGLLLHFRNTSGASVNATVKAVGVVGTVGTYTFALPAGSERFLYVSPPPVNVEKLPNDLYLMVIVGQLDLSARWELSFSGTSGVTVAAFDLLASVREVA